MITQKQKIELKEKLQDEQNDIVETRFNHNELNYLIDLVVNDYIGTKLKEVKK